ncbi:MAG TPA: pyridoxal-dependent decarboxylase [Gemmatimonadota bacterium]|nr:pyridoxal-dependent decarboxylase [Gemmatimonadota bacterium]
MSDRPSGTLDPADWDAFRALAHRMVDDMVDWLETVEERPVWRPVPAEVQARFTGPVPRAGTDVEDVYREFRDYILPYPTGNVHPRFWGWVRGAGSPLGMMADMLASGMNPHTGGFDQSATYVERQVIGWMAELMGMPPESSGILVSGGSMANLVGLTVARLAKAGPDIRTKGLQDGGPPLVLYASRETHSSVQKAARLLGLGDDAYRRIAVDGQYRIDLAALAAAVEADRAAGRRPFCVVGNAGTVNIGATDDFPALADFCAAEDLWLHVDGAFGALAAWSPALADRVAGMERADSIAFDLHKWGSLPYDVGCALVRDPVVHRGAFELAPEYLAARPRGVAVGGATYSELGVQLSRRFRALKVWMALKVHGADGIAASVERNVAEAARLAAAIEAHPRLELAAPVPLNIVCFRYVAPDLSDERLDAVNEEILMRVQESGEAVPSSTVLNGRFVLRAGIVNQRTRDEDVDRLVELVVGTGDDVVREGQA